METEQLIRTLAADNPHHARPVGYVLALALLAAAPVSLVIFMMALGVRPDVMTAMHNPFFDLKFVITLALAISAIVVGLHLSRPEASLKGWGWLLLIPAGIIAAGIARRNDDAAAAADDDANGRQQFAGLHDLHSASVVAASGGCAGRLASRCAGTARACWRARRADLGRTCGDAVCLALHRRFAAICGDLVSDRNRCRDGGWRALGAKVLRF